MKRDPHQVCQNVACHGYNARVAGGRVGGFCPICQHPTRTERAARRIRAFLVMLALVAAVCACGGAAYCALD